MSKKKKWLIALTALVVITAGLFYFWQTWRPWQEGGLAEAKPPRLFAENDYQIEQRDDGTYIVIDKIGFSCKAPDNWRVEKEKTPDQTAQYWLSLEPILLGSSPDTTENCTIAIAAGQERENNKETKNNIDLLKKNPEKSTKIKPDYHFETAMISGYDALKWLSPELPLLGQSIGVDIPIGEKEIITIDIIYPIPLKARCSQSWQELIDSIVIK